MPKTIAVESLLAEVFDSMRESQRCAWGDEEYASRKHDFVFHMTDWKKDLAVLHALVAHPADFNEEQASDAIVGFLYHVIPHLNAAGRLLLDEVPDAFKNLYQTKD